MKDNNYYCLSPLSWNTTCWYSSPYWYTNSSGPDLSTWCPPSFVSIKIILNHNMCATCTHTHMHILVLCTRTHAHTYTHTHTHTLLCTRMRTHTHAHTHSLTNCPLLTLALLQSSALVTNSEQELLFAWSDPLMLTTPCLEKSYISLSNMMWNT